jgi:hypothetical protein
MQSIKKRPFKLTADYPEEWREQEWFFQWLKSAYPKIEEVTFHIPNQATRTVGEGAKLKRMGKKKGIPDVFMSYPVSPYFGLYIEFKKICDGIVKDDQLRMLNLFQNLGYCSAVAYGWRNAREIVVKYLHPLQSPGNTWKHEQIFV